MKIALRDLFWFILVVALCVAWILDRRSLSAVRQQALDAQRDSLIREFVRQQNEEYLDRTRIIDGGLREVFGHPLEPHPADPNVPAGVVAPPSVSLPSEVLRKVNSK